MFSIGAYGTVYKARDTANDEQVVALKKVRVPLTEEGVPMSTLREISLLKQLQKYEHPNIVRYVLLLNCQFLKIKIVMGTFKQAKKSGINTRSTPHLLFKYTFLS